MIRWRLLVLLMTAVLALNATPVASNAPEVRTLVAHFIDVGQGDATLLQGPDFTILIDAGRHDRNDVVPYLRAQGIESIDLLIGTHPHADHIGQFPQVLRAFPVREVWMSGDLHTTLTFERALDAVLASGAGYHEPRAGERATIGSAAIDVVNPDELTGDFHEGSLSVRVVYGEIALLFTGDAEAVTERRMVASGLPLRAHILQLGHHGSRTSSTRDFLEAVAPEVAIYSAGAGNVYGHPHAEVIDRLAELGIRTYGTDLYGTVRVVTDGWTYTVIPDRQLPEGNGETGNGETGNGPGGCRPGQVDVNTASRGELETIVHIGAQRVEDLKRLRPYATLAELVRIPGIAAARLRDIVAQDLACVSVAAAP